jgi:hypothetical protein
MTNLPESGVGRQVKGQQRRDSTILSANESSALIISIFYLRGFRTLGYYGPNDR